MRLIYKARWVVVILSVITLVIAFAVLFVGGTASINRLLLSGNILFIIVQTANMFVAFKNKHKDVGVCLLVYLLVNIALIWVIYVWSWNYTVKALTVGFE